MLLVQEFGMMVPIQIEQALVGHGFVTRSLTLNNTSTTVFVDGENTVDCNGRAPALMIPLGSNRDVDPEGII